VGSPWKEAADYCDELVPYIDRNGDTAYEPRFRYSNYIDAAIKGYDLISDLMGSCRGILRYRNGLIEPLIEHGDQVCEYYYSDRVKVSFVTGGGTSASRIYSDFSAYPDVFWRGAIGIITIAGEGISFGIKDQTATYIDLCVDLPSNPGSGITFVITKDNIKEGSFSFKELGDNDIPNVVRVEFQRRQVWNVKKQKYENEYQWDAIEQEVPEIYTWTDSTIRQNVKKIKTVKYSGVKRPTQAMRMGQFLADAIYFARWLCSFTTGIEGYQHAIGDIIGVTHVQAAWTNKEFRIIRLEEQEGDEILIDCMEYNRDVYEDEVNVLNTDPNYDDEGGSPWTVPPHVERFYVVQDLSAPDGVYKFYVFFKRPDESNYWFGAKIFISSYYGDQYVDSFTIPTPSVKLSSGINYSQTTISFDSSTLYGTFPTSGYFFVRWEKIKYTGISGDSFTGCSRAQDGTYGGEHPASSYCNLFQKETPYILTDNSYVGTEITLKAVSFVSAGVNAPMNSAPTFPIWVENNDPPPPNEGGSTCFPAGSMVLMADGSWKLIELVVVGDMVQGVHGPEVVKAMDTPLLGSRKMMAFDDGSCIWSEEHLFWTNKDNVEWWWTANPPLWRREVVTGIIAGLKDNFSVRTGDGFEFAHLSGWAKRNVIKVGGYNPRTKLYLPITNGSPIIVNGYLVAGGANEFGFDYSTINWNKDCKAIK
jgi:hypothetical protein